MELSTLCSVGKKGGALANFGNSLVPPENGWTQEKGNCEEPDCEFSADDPSLGVWLGGTVPGCTKVKMSPATFREFKISPKTASISSVYAGHDADNCIDGKTETFCQSDPSGLFPWIALDFGAPVWVKTVSITNRERCCGNRTKNVHVRVTNTTKPLSGKGSHKKLMKCT